MSLSVHLQVVDGRERSVALITLSTKKKKQHFDFATPTTNKEKQIFVLGLKGKVYIW